MDRNDFDDPEREAEWIKAQRQIVVNYLLDQGAEHGGVPEEPDIFVAPCFAIWPVRSRKVAGSIGWWAISGDLPTDCVSSSGIRDARAAMAAFAKQWHDLASHTLSGQRHPSVTIGRPEDWPELGDLLERRAASFEKWADDDEFWR